MPIAEKLRHSSSYRDASDRVRQRIADLREKRRQRAERAKLAVAKETAVPLEHAVSPEDVAEIEELRDTLLNNPDPDERADAVFGLSVEDNWDALQALLDARNDNDPEVRLEIAQALSDFDEYVTISDLSGLLEDENADVRFEALDIVGDKETPEAVEVARRLMKDPDPDVRSLAEAIVDFSEEDG